MFTTTAQKKAPRRGGVSATHYVLHIPSGDRTRCGRVRAKVNCLSPGEDESAEVVCLACRKAVSP
jgi:hypothetical protein